MCNDPSIQLQRTEKKTFWTKKQFEPKSSSNQKKKQFEKKLLDILKMQLSIKTHQVDPFDTLDDDDDDFQIVYFFHQIQTSLLVQYG